MKIWYQHKTRRTDCKKNEQTIG